MHDGQYTRVQLPVHGSLMVCSSIAQQCADSMANCRPCISADQMTGRQHLPNQLHYNCNFNKPMFHAAAGAGILPHAMQMPGPRGT